MTDTHKQARGQVVRCSPACPKNSSKSTLLLLLRGGRSQNSKGTRFVWSMLDVNYNGWGSIFIPIAPSFKNKTRYAPYVSPGSKISHIATNKGNIERQCSIYNIFSIKNITLDSKQWKDNSNLRVKTSIPQGQLTS